MRTLLWLLVILISYGSLYPFSFAVNEGSAAEFRRLFTEASLSMGRGDLIGNLLLFAPYGFIAALLSQPHRHPQRKLWLLLGAGAALALALQIAQLWLPSRVPELVDVVANIGGMAIGVWLAHSALRWLPAHFTASLSKGQGGPALIAVGLMLCWLAYLWFPLVPTIDLQNLRNAVKPLLLAPIPDWVASLRHATAWLVFFYCAGLLSARRPHGLLLAAASIALLGGKVFIAGATISASNVAGLGLALLGLPWLRRSWAHGLLISALLLSLFLSGLSPFKLNSLPQDFHWIPFTGMLEGGMGLNLLNLIEKSYFYTALILLIHLNGARPLAAASAVALCLAFIEAAQIFILGHTAESTDPLLALMLGLLLHQLGRSRPSGRRSSGA